MTSFGEPVAKDFHHRFEGKLLVSERSPFQKIEIYEHAHFGRVLMLEDTVQTTELDEFCYHEMLVHPVLASRESVDSVLIIGGGDGGTLRHVLMHQPTRAVMCEIDEAVVRVSREYMPSLSAGAFDDPRTELVIDDGAAFVARHQQTFDVIVVDSTDPVGPALILFSPEFYEGCRKALRPGGSIVTQTGTLLYHPEEFAAAVSNLSSVFDPVESYTGFVPTYPGVLWSYTIGTTGPPVSAARSDQLAARLERRGIETRYYTPELHNGMFALPAFISDTDAKAQAPSLPRV